MNFQKALAIGLVLLMLFSGFVGLSGTGGEKTVAEEHIIEGTPHAPIRINSNSDFTAENGVTGGNGTESDPYIISNYEKTPVVLKMLSS